MDTSRIVFITGVAGGIGGATARLFSEAGWRVIGADRRDLASAPGVHQFVHADIAVPAQVERAFRDIARQHGRLDAIVNSAAIQVNARLLDTSVDDWDAVMAANVRSAYLTARYGHPLLAVQGGAIINLSSVHAIATSVGIVAYATSKGALLAMTRAIAVEFAPDRIRVNAVLPGATDTPMLHAGLSRGHLDGGTPAERLETLARRTVLGRVAAPEEIAQAVLFLADAKRSSFMTGQALVVDGGATIKLSTE